MFNQKVNKMRKNQFSNLLTDLYTAYNPDYLKFVDSLVEKYSGLEFDAVQMIFIKYNHPQHAHYNEEMSTDEYIHKLLKDYRSDNRTLENFNISSQVLKNREIEQKKAEEAKKREEELELERKRQLDEQEKLRLKEESKSNKIAQEELSGVKRKLTETEEKIERAQRELDDKLKNIKQQISEASSIQEKKSMYDDVEISIKTDYTDSELILPNKEILAGLGKDARIIVNDKDGRVVGLVVEEILYDCISHPIGTPIIEIVLNKG